MAPDSRHRPGRPRSPEPPAALTAIVDRLTHPQVSRVGITTTSNGDWAMMVWVKSGATTPIEAIETEADGFPVIYEKEPIDPPVARPAYPGRGE